MINLPSFTEKEVLRFLREKKAQGEVTRLKYLYCLLPRSITYLQRISSLNRKDERRHVKLLKTRFRELIEALSQFKLVKIWEESKVKYLTITDLGIRYLEDPRASIKHKKIFFTTQRLLISTQNTVKALKAKCKTVLLAVAKFFSKFLIGLLTIIGVVVSGYLLWLFFSLTIIFIYELVYKLPILVLIEYHPWLTLFVQSFSIIFAVISLIAIYNIIKAFSRKLNRKKIGVKEIENKWKLILHKIWRVFPTFSLSKLKKIFKHRRKSVSFRPKKETLRPIKKNLYWIPLFGIPLYFLTYIGVLSSIIFYYRAYYMLPLDYPLPIESVYQTFPFMELISHVLGLLLSVFLTVLLAYLFNRSKNLEIKK